VNELKPCPFCGGDNIEMTRRDTRNYVQIVIKCKECAIQRLQRFIRLVNKAEALMVEHWNKRTPTPCCCLNGNLPISKCNDCNGCYIGDTYKKQ
jgi:Lar family restriction alleviation protein